MTRWLILFGATTVVACAPTAHTRSAWVTPSFQTADHAAIDTQIVVTLQDYGYQVERVPYSTRAPAGSPYLIARRPLNHVWDEIAVSWVSRSDVGCLCSQVLLRVMRRGPDGEVQPPTAPARAEADALITALEREYR